MARHVVHIHIQHMGERDVYYEHTVQTRHEGVARVTTRSPMRRHRRVWRGRTATRARVAVAFAFAFALCLALASAAVALAAATTRGVVHHRQHRHGAPSSSSNVVVVVAMDGSVRAIDVESGEERWTFDSGGVLTGGSWDASSAEGEFDEDAFDEYASSSSSGASMIASPIGGTRRGGGARRVFPGIDGALYAHSIDARDGSAKHVVRRLPVTTRELVDASPSATRDGALVVGKRASMVYGLHPRTGEVVRNIDVDGTTTSVLEDDDVDAGDLIYVGRTEYVVRSVDAKSGEERWNVTHGELRTMTRDDDSGRLQIGAERARAESTGGASFAIGPGNTLRATDAKTGKVKWSAKLSSLPLGVSDAKGNVVIEHAAQVQHDGDRIIIGAHAGGLFALPYTDSVGAGLEDGAAPNGALVPLGDREDFVRIDIGADDDDWSCIPEDLVKETLERTAAQLGGKTRQRDDIVGVVMSAVAGFVVVFVFGRNRSAEVPPSNDDSSKQTSEQTSEQLSAAAKKRAKKRAKQAEAKAAEAELIAKVQSVVEDRKREETRVGRLVIKPTVLGYGSCGTIVFEGVMDGRRVAVKRLLAQFHELARKELEALIASDEHPNILRCFALEEDADFVYMALELCVSSLARIVDPPTDDEDAKANAELLEFTCVDARTKHPTPQAIRILHDVASGLNALHEQGIVHRDLKPQNVLITANSRGKIADMGLAKRLNISEGTSFETHIAGGPHTQNAAGTSGWQAPERLTQGRQSRSVDIFSLGCLMYYTLTGGEHPFGARMQRDSNVVARKFDLSALDQFPEAQALIRACIDDDPSKRPSTKEILAHPMWWDAEKKIQFLIDASDRVELEDRMSDRTMLREFESCATKAIACADWTVKLDKELLENMGRYREYDGSSLRDLLRVFRNKANHYRELPPRLQRKLGSYPDGFWNYVSTRFPSLLLHVRAFFITRTPSANEATLVKYFTTVDGPLAAFAPPPAVSTEPDALRDQPLVAPQIFPNRPGRDACEFYMKTGRCKFGETCKFHHPPGLHWD